MNSKNERFAKFMHILLCMLSVCLTLSCEAATITDPKPDFPPQPPAFESDDSWIQYHYEFYGTPSWAGDIDGQFDYINWHTEETISRHKTNGTSISTSRTATHNISVAISYCGGPNEVYENDEACVNGTCATQEINPGNGYFAGGSTFWFTSHDGNPGGSDSDNDIVKDYTTNAVPNGYLVTAESLFSYYHAVNPHEPTYCGGLAPAFFIWGAGHYYDLELFLTNGSALPNSFPQPQSPIGGYGPGVPDDIGFPNTMSLNSSNNFSFSMNVESNVAYTVEASTNLVLWTDLAVFSTNSTNANFTDTNANAFDHRFYRYTDGTNDSEIFAYIKLVEPSGFSLISDPLVGLAGFTLDAILTNVPSGTQIYKWNETSQAFDPAYEFTNSAWFPDGLATLMPSEGAFLHVPGTNSITLTFCGLVNQGSNSCTIPPGQSIRSSMLPIAESLDSLQFPAVDGDEITHWDPITQSYDVEYTYLDGYGWFGSGGLGAPVPAVGESFFVASPHTMTTNRTWTADLTVSP